jgi:hypothetical protein
MLGDAMLRLCSDHTDPDHYNVSLMDIADHLFGAFSWGDFDSFDGYGTVSDAANAMNDLETENKRLVAERDSLAADAAKLKEEVERLTKENEALRAEEPVGYVPVYPDDMVWVVLRDNDENDYLVFEKREGAECYRDSFDDSAEYSSVVRPEMASNFDFTGCILSEHGTWDDDKNPDLPPKRVASAAIPQPKPAPPPPIKPEPITPPQLRPVGRGRHFGAYPDPQRMTRLRDLTARLRLDNTAFLRLLIDYECDHPPQVLPPRRKRANRVHHFGCYPDDATWAKIRQLLEKYRIDNTELLSYLVDKGIQ